MQHLSTAFLIIALVIVVNQGGATAQDDSQADQIADETKNRVLTIVDGPKYVEPFNQTARPPANLTQPEQRPPSKPPHPAPDKNIPNFEDPFRPYHGFVRQNVPPSPRHIYQKPLKLRHTYRVVPVHRNIHYAKQSTRQPLVFAASTGRPVRVPLKASPAVPKFNVPIETINGIRTEPVRPPKGFPNTTTTTTTSTTTTTTQRPLRNKRIWPKHVEKKNYVLLRATNTITGNDTIAKNNSTSTNSTDLEIASATHYRFRYVNTNRTKHATTTFVPLTITRGYRRVTRVPNHSTTTAAYGNTNYSRIATNDWVPIVPSHYPNPNNKRRRPKQTPMSRRSDVRDIEFTSPDEHPEPEESKRTVYLQSFGILPVGAPAAEAGQVLAGGRKKMVIFRKRNKRPLNMRVYSGYSPKPGARPAASVNVGGPDLSPDASAHAPPRIITRIKHHHHHHHHRYIKTVEKPIKVPYKVEVPKPYPVTVEKKVPVAVEKIKIVEKPVPYPVQVEKRVPYPVQVAVPHPVPYKVIEKEYVPKPYPVYQQVPVLKHVEVKVPQPVPVQVEKRVPYPVEVKVPVPVYHPYPVNVTIEKRVPYPVPVRVLVPQPYPVETRVPYPVEVKVKEPVEVVKHVPIKVPYPQPIPVPTPVAVAVEKRVPYPVEVEKKVPVPYKVIVPQKVEVEKKVPVYVPRPYPVEKQVPVPVKVPVPVPYNVPVYGDVPAYFNHPYSYYNYNHAQASAEVTSTPHHIVTVHGNTGFAGFQSRSDKTETTSAESLEATEATTKKQETVTSEATTNATTKAS